ncbi:MAG: LysM peptidoglycan-binding domain-containing protein [Saprospiraceae bacterium]
MKLLSSLLSLMLLLATINMAQAQCNPATESGIHVVQKGETLYQIAAKYGVSVAEICTQNQLTLNQTIPVCTELSIKEARLAARPMEFNRTQNIEVFTDKSVAQNTQKQMGNKHRVKEGETIAALAELYGYTEKRFRKFNAMGPYEEVTPGSILLSSDCSCGRIGTGTQMTNLSQNNNAQANTQTTAMGNTMKPTNTTNTNTTNATSTPMVASTQAAASYMTKEELSMVDEINLLRSNPAGYIQYIETYVRNEKANNGFPIDQNVVDELIRELKKTPTLSTLSPTACIYDAAKKHGEDLIKMGSIGHVGSDGAWPWDRVKRACSQMTDGNENLVGGPDQVRASVIILLIDEGIPNRGHRKTLLNPKWKYVATRKVGKVGYMPNSWVQKFGA